MGLGELSELCKKRRDHHARHCSQVLQKGRPKGRQFTPVFKQRQMPEEFHCSLLLSVHMHALFWLYLGLHMM